MPSKDTPKYPLIRVEPPGPKAKELINLDEQLLMQSFSRWYPLVVDKARDFLVWDVDGNVYIDLNSGLVVCNVGHCHPKVIANIKKQLDHFLHYSVTDFYYPQVIDLSKKLIKITPGDYAKKVFYCNSGAEAIEGSIKISRGYFESRRPYIIAFTGSFHGRTLGAVSLTSSKPVQRKGFMPLLPGVEHVPYPYCYRCPYRLQYPDCDLWCVDFIEEWLFKKYVPPEETAAIVFEPIAGEGGYIVPPPEFFPKLRKLADKYDILLIDDEIQAGMGRTGKWFAIEHWNITPDIVTIAKGIAAGLPLGVIVGRADIMKLPRGSHASTFGGNPVSCAAANAVIDIIHEEKLLDNAKKIGEYTMKRFKEMMDYIEIIGDVRGKGLMIGIELVKDRKTRIPASKTLAELLREAFKNGILLTGAGLSVIRIAPPLTITLDAMEKAINIIEPLLKNCKNCHNL